MTKIIKEGEFLILVDQRTNTVAKHNVQLVDHKDDDSYPNRFEMIIEDVTRMHENTDARFSDFGYDNYAGYSIDRAVEEGIYSSEEEAHQDMLDNLQDADIEEELVNWDIDYVRDNTQTILISESIRKTAEQILDDIESEFTMSEQANFNNRYNIYYVKDDDYVYMTDATMFDDIEMFFENFAFKYLIKQFDSEREYFTDRQIEVSLKRKYEIPLSSTERGILMQLRNKIDKAKTIAELSFNLTH